MRFSNRQYGVEPPPHVAQEIDGAPHQGASLRATLLVLLCVAACGCRRWAYDDGQLLGDVPMSISVQTEAFTDGQQIPKKYTGDGADVSPPVSWSGAPAETRSLALICDDPDAPRPEPWVHWLIYNIPADATSLAEGIAATARPDAPAGTCQGENSWGRLGYGGPAPPRGHGVHHYHFRLLALDADLGLEPGLDKSALLEAVADHVLAQGELIGTYQR